MPKVMLRDVVDGDLRYQCLMFVCPGCIAMFGDPDTGLHMLTVNTEISKPSWSFDGNLDWPTVSPSILTWKGPPPVEGEPDTRGRCHSMLEKGEFRYLGDSTHSLAGQTVPMPDLPDWVLDEPAP